MKTTIKSLSEKSGVAPASVNGFVKTLQALGKATEVGKVVKPEGQRGRAASIYDVDDEIAGLFETEKAEQKEESLV